jgi:hypothetical protein
MNRKNIIALGVSCILLVSSAYAQANRKGKATPDDSKTDLKKLDSLVRMVLKGDAGFGALPFFADYFEESALKIRPQAEAAYRHRMERKQTEKKYRIEIEYAYYQSMAKTLEEMNEPQKIIDASKVRTAKSSPADLAKAEQEWRALAARLLSIHKRCPLRGRAATSRTQASANSGGQR